MSSAQPANTPTEWVAQWAWGAREKIWHARLRETLGWVYTRCGRRLDRNGDWDILYSASDGGIMKGERMCKSCLKISQNSD